MSKWSRNRAAVLIAFLAGAIVSVVLLAPGGPGAIAQVRAGSSHALLAPKDDHVRSLRVLTFNMMGLPQPLGGDETRYDDIAAAIRDYDIVTVQEAFTKSARDALASTPFPYQKYGNFGVLPGQRLGDGLVVLSKFPIVSTAFTTYEGCYWTDCLARKGALLVRLDVQGVEVDVYTTHLQSMLDDPDGRATRAKQVGELGAFIRRTARGNPALVLGDFNARDSQYTHHQMVDSLGARDLWPERGGRLGEGGAAGEAGGTYCDDSGCERIDYIFSRAGRYHDVRAAGMLVRLNEKVRGRFLSDHFAVEAELEVITTSAASPRVGLPTAG